MKPHQKVPLIFLYTDNRSAIEGATRFQKLVFLAQEETDIEDFYEYRADRFGPYSYGLRQNLEVLYDEGYLDRRVETTRYGTPRIVYSITPDGDQAVRELLKKANNSVFDLIEETKQKWNNTSTSELLDYVYGKYTNYCTASEITQGTQMDPDAIAELGTDAKRTPADPETWGDLLTPTPHTLYQLPKRDTNAYFYYFTDSQYSRQASKFKVLDNQLTLIGRNRTQAEVVMIDRDRIRTERWDLLTEGFGIDDYPALVVSEGELGVSDLELTATSFEPTGAAYAKLENGIIADDLLGDVDDVTNFLNNLFDCARDGELETGMRKKKIKSSLTIAGKEIKDILSVPV
ncbi:PadR family transcriptional regulator [Halomicrobium sp. IBSBa]|uniref:PadR family transcriptional regulator n=1 Tax=Halomicrobium sp. IBSBa TaxID=2778916 RepID=UPI001ABF662E|nr:PadR family transcriptional regulator [Halomicrobium sp. IBSBa]MBO4248366.1 PadR family transcriptional regulator [Halomicrobium sp. IBSBa]